MKKIFLLSLLLISSRLYADPMPWSWPGYLRSLCQNPVIKCLAYQDGDVSVKFMYKGDGYKRLFEIDWELYESFIPLYQLQGEDRIQPSRLIILERKKERLRFGQALCESGMVGCGIAVARIGVWYPGLLMAMTCTLGAKYCTLRIEDEVAEIDAEVADIKSKMGEGGESIGGASDPNAPEASSHIPPPAKKLPDGTVTINDNPRPKPHHP